MSQICKFYTNKNVLITGGTGFLGRVLIEKLLRTTAVERIYLIVREKKKFSVDDRLKQIFESPLFDTLEKYNPSFTNQVIAVKGNFDSDHLGLSESDKEVFRSQVNVVFHVASSVRFNGHLKEAYQFNVLGTENLLNFCEKIDNLNSFVYVSSFFCNSRKKIVDETPYNNLPSKKEIEEVLNRMSYEEIVEITPKLLKDEGNTYLATKGLAEHSVINSSYKFPIAIFRPSVVSSMYYNDPVQHWSDNHGLPNSLVLGIADGQLDKIPNCDYDLDLVPVDLTISALISSAWHIQLKATKHKTIYNFCSSVDNPITFNNFIHLINHNLNRKISYVRLDSVNDVKMHSDYKKKKLTNSEKLHILLYVAMERLITMGKASNANVKLMWKSMNEDDRKLFNFDTSKIQWIPYFQNYYEGLKMYMLGKKHQL